MNVGRVALVTGASSGIGAATVRALATVGCEGVGAARRVERVEEVVRGVGGRALRLDVTDPDSAAELAESLPDLSVVVNNAGGALGLEPLAEADEENWREMYEANVMGVMRVTKALLPALERSGNGHIVVIGSVAGVEVYPGGGGYTAAKHGIVGLMREYANILAPHSIRVNSVHPTGVDTPMINNDFIREWLQRMGTQASSNALPVPAIEAQDVANAVAYLVSDAARYVTGVTLPVDAGAVNKR